MALLVVWSHSFALYFGSEDSEPLSQITNGHYNSGNLAVFVFFIISGFLVFQSYENTPSTFRYFNKRMRRIYPGYVVATSICAFIVIPVFSTRSLSDYSSTEIVSTLLLNLVLKNHFPISDAFSQNQSHSINGSLWSIPYEFWCYIGIAALGALRLLKYRFVSLAIITIAMLARLLLDATDRRPGGGILEQIIGWPYLWFSIIPCFMIGLAAYQYRRAIPRNRTILILLISGFLIACRLPRDGLHQKLIVDVLFPFVASYSVFYFAFESSGAAVLSRLGDFSYGTYLYGYAIQQMLLASFQSLQFTVFVSASLFLSATAGIISWYVVEHWFLPSRNPPARAPAGI
jgi:peptidoglycan/LPS O-acetylase OafA/YrhL